MTLTTDSINKDSSTEEAVIGVLMSHPNAAALTPMLAREGTVRTDTGTSKVSLWLVPGAMIGDRLLIRDGVAIADFGPEPDDPATSETP